MYHNIAKTCSCSPSPCVVRPTPVRQGDGDGAGVVGQHTVRHVNTVLILGPHLTSVGSGPRTLKHTSTIKTTCPTGPLHVSKSSKGSLG